MPQRRPRAFQWAVLPRYARALAVLSCAAIAGFSCSGSRGGEASYFVSVSKGAGPGQTGHDKDDAGNGAPPNEGAVQALVAPKEDERILSAFSLNLDADEDDEQVLVVRKTGGDDQALWIAVVDRGPEGEYQFVWEAATAIASLNSLSLSQRDLLGEGDPALLCLGLGPRGSQALSAFNLGDLRGPEPAGKLLFSLEADGIEILGPEQAASEAGDSPSALVIASTTESPQPGAPGTKRLERTFWRYSAKDGRYLEAERQLSLAASLDAGLAKRYLTGKPEDVEGFLEGLWYLSDGPKPGAMGSRFVQFLPRERSISFIQVTDLTSIAVFSWLSSQSTRAGLYATSNSAAVGSMRRFIDVSLASADSVNLRIVEDLTIRGDSDVEWNGLYRRLDRQPDQALASAQPICPRPNGAFKDERGNDYVFDWPRFSLRMGKEARLGVFTSYSASQRSILGLRYLETSGQALNEESYELSQGPMGEYRLIPIRLSVDGLVLLDKEPIYLKPIK